MSLIEAFSTPEAEATPQAIAKHVWESYLGEGSSGSVDRDGEVTNPHRRRRAHMAERLRYYRDAYIKDVDSLIDLVFENEKVREQRKKLREMAMAINPTRRLIDELSAVYDKPAKRTFRDKAKQAQLADLEADFELHELYQEAHRLVNLLNEVLLWEVESPATKRRSLRILTPDTFDVIPDPRDQLEVGGIIIDLEPMTLNTGAHRERLPHWEVWDDTHVFTLNGRGELIDSEEHDRGRLPGVLVHRRKPTDGLLDSTSGRDILAAHKAVTFLSLLVLRLAKSQGERQPILKGMLARMAKGQAMDGETPIALPPDVDLTMLDSKTDPDHFLKGVKHFIGGVAQTYGMSYEQFTFTETTEATSGKAYKVRREKLTELRNQQAKRWRMTEPDVVDLLGLDPDGYSVDFHEMALPQDPGEELDVFDRKVKKGLDNPVDYLMRRDPDLTEIRALAEIRRNIRITSMVWDWLAKRNIAGGAGAGEGAEAATPEQNGADNEPADDDGDESAEADDQEGAAA